MDQIQTLTVEEATEKLRTMGVRISPDTLRRGLQQKVFPFGDCIISEKAPRFLIYGKLFQKWVAERAAEGAEA